MAARSFHENTRGSLLHRFRVVELALKLDQRLLANPNKAAAGPVEIDNDTQNHDNCESE